LHAQAAVHASQGATQLLQQSSAVSGLAMDSQSAQVTPEVAESLALATQATEDANHEIDLGGLAANTQKFDEMRRVRKQTHAILTGDGGLVVDAAAYALQNDLDKEIEQELQIPPFIPGADGSESKIKRIPSP
jgi:hypothetical protein